jgi:hypothetical protein
MKTKEKFQQYALYRKYCEQCGITAEEMRNYGMTFDEFCKEDVGEYFIDENGRVF